jgi:phage terminase small subunit
MVTTNGSGEKPTRTGDRPSGKKGGHGLVLALAMGCSVPEAARRAGIGQATAYVRLRDPEFRKEVAKARQDILERAVAKLVSAAVESVDALTGALKSKNEATRIRAATAVLTHMIQGVGLTEILRRIEALEERSR